MKKRDVINQYKEIANSFQSHEEMWDLFKSTNDIKLFDFCLDNDGIWKRLSMKWLYDYFLSKEEYKKCKTLNKLMKKYYVGNKDIQKENNEKLKEYLEYSNDPKE